jgi:hypothetical protein
MSLLLIHPPAAKPAEPPLGLAVLQAHLRAGGAEVRVFDANLDAYLQLLQPARLEAAAGSAPEPRLRRALRHAVAALALLRSPAAMNRTARYVTAVNHLNDALGAYRGEGGEERLTLGDYRHQRLSEFTPEHLERLATGRERTLFHDYFVRQVLPQVLAWRPQRIGLSINYRHQVLPAFELAGLLRRQLPGVELIAGGGMIGSWLPALQGGLRLPPFDRLVAGAGEEPLQRMIQGQSGTETLLNGADRANFLPDFDGLEPAAYFSPLPVLPVTATRGCYWARCLFCPEAAAPAPAYQPLPGKALPGLLRQLADRWQVRHFHLTDNAIPLPALRALAGSPELMADLAWYGFVRFEPQLLRGELLPGLARAGCRLLQLGLESGAQPVLDRLGKGTRVEVAAEVLRRARQAGIATYVYVLLGTPEESLDELLQTRDFLQRHGDHIDFLNLAIMNLPRHASLGAAAAGSDDALEPLGLYRPVTEDARERRTARRFLQQELLGEPAIRAIVRRTPPLFTSNHAFFFPRS